MSADTAEPSPTHPGGPPQPAAVATLAGGGVSAAAILWLLVRLQDSVGDMSGRVAVLGEQVSAARQQVSDVRQAQAAIGDDVADIQRRMAIIEAQQPTAGRR